MRRLTFQAALLALTVMGVVAFDAATANAALRNRYSFATDATDSIGAQNGTLVGTNGSFAGGQLVLANTGQGSENPPPEGAFLDLPNGLISSAANVGGVVTVEMWITMSQNRDWAAAFTAGISTAGEGASAGGNGDQPFIQIIPRTGDGGQGNDVRVTSNSFGGDEGFVDDLGAGNGTDLTVGRREHLVSVFDQSGGLPGTLTVYRNGASMGTATIAANLDLKTFLRADATGGDVNVWLGRSQWPDSLVAASYDEFRIYDSAVSANQAYINTVFGPDVVGATAIPTIEVNKGTGVITLKNPAAVPINLEYYSITSAAGALKPTTWSSLDDQNLNALDGTDVGSFPGDSAGEGWDEAGGSNSNQLVEIFLRSSGATLAANASISLSSAYNTATFGAANGDLVFQVGVANGAVSSRSLVTLPVTYVGGGIPGDYNLNGSVDAADYTLYRDTLGATVAPGTGADGNNSGTIDAGDYTVWKNGFSAASAAVASSSAVPEPTTMMLAALVLVGMSVGRCARK